MLVLVLVEEQVIAWLAGWLELLGELIDALMDRWFVDFRCFTRGLFY